MFTINPNPPNSGETYDLAKFLSWTGDCYDLLNSPFLNKFISLPIYKVYNVNTGHKNLDQISQDFYGSPFFTFYIAYYNGLDTEILLEDTLLNMFNIDDFTNLYQNLVKGVIV